MFPPRNKEGAPTTLPCDGRRLQNTGQQHSWPRPGRLECRPRGTVYVRHTHHVAHWTLWRNVFCCQPTRPRSTNLYSLWGQWHARFSCVSPWVFSPMPEEQGTFSCLVCLHWLKSAQHEASSASPGQKIAHLNYPRLAGCWRDGRLKVVRHQGFPPHCFMFVCS